ncbi:hypothetical protein H4R18_004493 [Coemansia javaensis]|uniref:Uncharacterized protein n=1 Tax=Coemansia javaensis TaxID=2761396 RepID=A0A9W8H5I6_9FUNG|nr:hypothetical protein H4R18_004493 [Coemansia javaensis]
MDYVFWSFAALALLGVWYLLGLFLRRRALLRARLGRGRSRASVLPLFGDYGLEGGLGAFIRDYRAGLSSINFDIGANIEAGDSRPGLDSEEVRRIMDEHGVSFDKARLMRQQRLMQRNGIDPTTGMPLDPKAVTFA